MRFWVGCTKSQCERTSLYIAPYDMNLYYAVHSFYYFAITSSYNAQFSLTIKDRTYLGAFFIVYAPMTTYLRDLIQSIGRYGGHSWYETGFKGFMDAQVVSPLSTNFG